MLKVKTLWGGRKLIVKEKGFGALGDQAAIITPSPPEMPTRYNVKEYML